MKTHRTMMVLAGLAALALPGAAQTSQTKTNDSHTKAMELLRRTLAEQQKNPDKVIRTLTNLPPEQSKASVATNAPVPLPTRAELERQYLDGKLTAKQLQKAMEQLEEQQKQQQAAARASTNRQHWLRAPGPPQVNKPASPAPKPAATPATSPKGTVTTVVTPPPGTVTAPNQPGEAAEQKTLTEVEAKIDEMLRQKAAREKAALTNAAAATNNIPATPQTKRQRLDALLRQLIDGKLNDAEYSEKRAKIVAEPD